jgi:hypothetical protein
MRNTARFIFFLETLLANRPDLAGLPFIMGDACRLKKSERLDFKSEVDLVRGGFTDADLTGGLGRFWREFDAKRLEQVSSDSKDRFTVASLMQILAPESRECHLMLVWRLPAIGSPDIIVRVDVTYLRQNFSLLQKDAGTDGWPEMRRFDYLARSRVATESEAQTYRKAFAGQAGLSPYRQAALNALRHLTGKDAGATTEQWRTALGL